MLPSGTDLLSGETSFRLVKLMFCSSLYFKIGLRAFIVGTLELLIKKGLKTSQYKAQQPL